MGLLKAGLPRQPERGELTLGGHGQQMAAKIFLQLAKFHGHPE